MRGLIFFEAKGVDILDEAMVEDEEGSHLRNKLTRIVMFARSPAMNRKIAITTVLGAKSWIIQRGIVGSKTKAKRLKKKILQQISQKKTILKSCSSLLLNSEEREGKDEEPNTKNTWFLDSGCSHHITGDRKSFIELDANFSSQVELRDSKHLKIEGQGVVAVNTNGGDKRHIYDIYYSSKITHNLLSVG